jgi:hypothetical protein
MPGLIPGSIRSGNFCIVCIVTIHSSVLPDWSSLFFSIAPKPSHHFHDAQSE